MNVKKSLENRIRGWFPQEPHQPEKRAKVKLSSQTPPAPIFFRVSGLLFSAIGVFLMVIFLYSNFIYDFSIYKVLVTIGGDLFPLAFVAGIPFVIAGMTFNAHSIQSNSRFIRKPFLIAGLTLLTLSIFYSIFEVLAGMQMAPQQYVVNVIPYQNYFTLSGFVGGFILFIGLLKWSALSSLIKKSYYVLAAGLIISIASAVIPVLQFYPVGVSFANILAGHPLWLFYMVLGPIGTICVISGWVAIFSVTAKKRPFLLPTLFILMLVIALFLSLIPV